MADSDTSTAPTASNEVDVGKDVEALGAEQTKVKADLARLNATAQAFTRQAVEKRVHSWWNAHIPNSPVAADTASYNFLFAKLTSLVDAIMEGA